MVDFGGMLTVYSQTSMTRAACAKFEVGAPAVPHVCDPVLPGANPTYHISMDSHPKHFREGQRFCGHFVAFVKAVHLLSLFAPRLQKSTMR